MRLRITAGVGEQGEWGAWTLRFSREDARASAPREALRAPLCAPARGCVRSLRVGCPHQQAAG